MKKEISKLISLLLVVGLLVTSFAACSDSKDKKDDKSSEKPSSSTVDDSSWDDTSDEGDIDDDDEYDDDDVYIDDYEDDYFDTIYIDRPNSDGAISIGKKISASDKKKGKDDGDDDPTVGPDPDTGDIGGEDIEYPVLNMKKGEYVDSDTRTVTVDNTTSGIFSKGFNKIGGNVYPTYSTYYSQTNAYTIPALMELNAKRFNDSHPAIVRSWFQNDWIITEEQKDVNVEWEDNKDYVNYMKGIYAFNNKSTKDDDWWKSVVDYWAMLDEAGTEVYPCFSWKNHSRIQSWISFNPSAPKNGAPYDLKAHAKACIAFLKYCKTDPNGPKLTNLNNISFNNEANKWNAKGDFSCIGDKRFVWRQMAQECRDLMDKDPALKNMTISGIEQSGLIATSDEAYVSPYMRKYAFGLLDWYTFHAYYNYSQYPDGYSSLFDGLNFIVHWYSETDKKGNIKKMSDCYITEYYTADPANNSDSGADYIWEDLGWEFSECGMFIACANTGTKGMLCWGFAGGILPDPVFFDPADNNTAAWYLVRITPNGNSIGKVNNSYYLESMLNNYIPDKANVHKTTWNGDDIKCASFTSPDGKDFSFLVESGEADENKYIDVTLKKALSVKKLYVYRYQFKWNRSSEKTYDDTQETGNVNTANTQATIPTLSTTVDLEGGKKFEYEIGTQYTFCIFTTIAPLKQLQIMNGTKHAVYNEMKTNGTLTLTAKRIDCQPSDQLVWEIKRYSNVAKTVRTVAQKIVNRTDVTTMGKIVQDGDSMTYTPPADAKPGDMVAVRCTVKGTKRFASAVIRFTK